MNPNVWGPACWDLLFYITFHVDLKQNISHIQTLFHLLEILLPCSHCRRHYALYKKQVPPTTNIKKDQAESAAQWLWIIHDMVNQNLGKICIDYSSLKKKHSSFTCLVSDLTIFDSLLFMWLSSKHKKKTVEGIQIIILLLKSIRSFKVCECFDIHEEWSWKDIVRNKNKLLVHYGMREQTLDEIYIQYQHAIST